MPNHWLKKYIIVAPDHEHDLERAAAVHQFHGNMSREGSEVAAYQDYRKMQLHKAAAYHLEGMEAAKDRKDDGSHRKHLGMYALLCKELGYRHTDHPAPGVKAHKGTFGDIEDFKSHPADLLVLAKV